MGMPPVRLDQPDFPGEPGWTKPKTNSSDPFYAVLDEIRELYAAKNAQYADESDTIRNFKAGGAMCRSFMKGPMPREMYHLLTLASKQIDHVYKGAGEEMKDDERLVWWDHVRDIAVYMIILLGMLKHD